MSGCWRSLTRSVRGDGSSGQVRHDGPVAPEPMGGGAPAWKPWRAAVGFVAAVALALAGRAIVSGESSSPLLAVALALIVLSLAPIGLAIVAAGMDAAPTARDFGLLRPRLARAVALALAIWVGTSLMIVMWVETLGLDGEEGQVLTERLGTEGTLSVVTLIVIVAVLAPVGEEFLFRGYIFRALRNWRPAWPAAIAAGGLFAATHIGWLPVALIVPTALIGIALCLLYEWTGSLYPCIAVHAINNSIPVGSALNWSWQTTLLIVFSTLAALTIAKVIGLWLDDTYLKRSRRQTHAAPTR